MGSDPARVGSAGLLALAAATLVTLVCTLSVERRDAGIADVGWGLGFVALAWLYCALSPRATRRAWLVAGLIVSARRSAGRDRSPAPA